MTADALRRVVAFAVLMENGGGILDKSPAYVAEKCQTVALADSGPPDWALDTRNRAKYWDWVETWGKGLPW